MKAIGTILVATLVILPWCLTPIFGQQTTTAAPSAQPGADRKIIVTKRIVTPDGTETTETIVKRGQAAASFDAEAYLRENEGDNVDIQIREEADNGNFVRITTSDAGDSDVFDVDVDVDVDWDEINDAMAQAGVAMRGMGQNIQTWVMPACDDKRGFLGVEEDSDEDEDAEGLVVEVVRGSAAETAGLRSNDLLLALNDTKINRWSDLTDFMANSKPGDQVRIAYRRGNAANTATATLTKRSEVKSTCGEAEKHGFLGVSPDGDDEEDAVGVRVDVIDESAAASAGLQDGDEIVGLNDTEVRDWEDIEDFMSDTKTGDKIRVGYRRDGAAKTAEATLGEPRKQEWGTGQSWNRNSNDNWSNDYDVEVRQKPACLGVYSGAWSEGNQQGSKVSEFTTESAARDASMQVGDVITAVNGQVVKSHDELWNEIAKYQPGDQVSVVFLRENGPQTIQATLKACRDQNRVTMSTNEESGPSEQRRFYAWSWGNDEQARLRTRQVITIHRGQEGDGAQPAATPTPETAPPAQDRSLQLQAFRAYPNPTSGQVTVEFRGEAVPTFITLLDVSGRQLFREELNAFNGDYNQQFDLSEYAKGTIIIQVTQGGKVFNEQIIVN